MKLDEKRSELLILALLFLIPFSAAGYYLLSRSLPWWTDPGEWIMYAHGIKGSILSLFGIIDTEQEKLLIAPMLNINPWQYPPLFPIMLAALSYLIDELFAIKLLALILFSLQSFPVYYIAKRITKSKLAALFSGLAACISPIQAEMIGWGGYPNLLAMILLAFSFLALIDFNEKGGKKAFALAVASGTLTVLAHHLTTIILLAVPIIWISFTYLVNRFPKYMLQDGRRENLLRVRRVSLVLITWLAAFILYRIAIWPPQYDPDNVAAFYALRFDPITMVPWIFKGALPLLLILIISILGFLELRKWFEIRYLTFIEAWAFVPIAVTQAYLLGIYIDYNRMFIFVVQPIYLLISLPLAAAMRSNKPMIGMGYITKGIEWLIGVRIDARKVGALILFALTVLSSLSMLQLGFNTIGNVNSWYNGIDMYGDKPKLQALNWIRNNTEPNSTFIADENLGRWIEGYAQRPVYIYDSPQYLFLVGQLHRQQIAESILFANSIIANCYARVYDQSPFGKYSPLIKLQWQGNFVNLISIDEGASNITIGKGYAKLFDGNRTYRASANFNGTGFSISYNLHNLSIKKVVSINGNKISLHYSIDDANYSVKGLTLLLNIADDSSYTSGIEKVGDTINIEVANGLVSILSNGNGTLYGHNNLIYSFDSHSNRIDAKINLTLRIDGINTDCKTEAKSSLSLLKENGISYIAIPRLEGQSQPRTTQYYQHLMLSNYLTPVYINERVIILAVKA